VSRAAGARLPRFGTTLLVAAGVAPDLDYASYFAGASSFLASHRSALHSLSGGVALACALAAIACWVEKKWPPLASVRARKAQPPLSFLPALALAVIGIAAHDVLDLASSEGIQLFWPFRSHWTRWSLTQNFDPWILALLITALLLPQLFRLVREEVGARSKRATGAGTAIAALVLLCAYFGGRAYLHSRALETLLSSEYHGREPLAAGAFPSSSNPFEWRGVVSTENTLEEIAVNLQSGADFNPDRSLTHYKPADSLVLDAAQKAPATQKFLSYAELPLASVARREDGYRIELRDLQFPQGDTTPANIAVRVDLNSAYRITRQQLRYASAGAE